MSHLPANRSFVVRFSDKADPTGACLCGRVEHLQSGTTLHFKSEYDLKQFFTHILEDVGQARHGGQAQEDSDQ